MRRRAVAFTICLLACGISSARPQGSISIPTGPSAIPLDVSNKMDRQEQRLEDIDKRLALIEKSVAGLETDVRGLVRTNTVIDFLVDMTKLFIPGMFLTIFGIWINRKWREQHKGTTPSANPQESKGGQ